MTIPKILYIHHGSVPGGAPTSLRTMIRGLKNEYDNKVNIKVLCAYESMIPYFKEIKGIDVEKYIRPCTISGKVFIWGDLFHIKKILYFIYELLLSPWIIRKEIEILKKENANLLHLNSSILWSSAIAGKILKIPVVWHIRETLSGGKFNIRKKLYSTFIKKTADRIICISPSELNNISGNHSKNASVIYNSVDFSNFDRHQSAVEKERSTSEKSEQFIIVSLGGLSFRKGTYQLIDAMKILDHRFKMIIAGHCSLNVNNKFVPIKKTTLQLENILIQLNLKKYYSWFYTYRVQQSLQNVDSTKLEFIGVVNNIFNLLNLCDVLVFAGTTPHFARPVFEAWTLKKPVIVFDSIVMQQEIFHNNDGIIVKEHSGKALAEAISFLYQNPDKCQVFGKKGYIKAMEKFNLPKNTLKLISIYRKFLRDL